MPIQLIHPKLGHFFFSAEGTKNGFQRLKIAEDIYRLRNLDNVKNFILQNVDVSCCGVSLDSNNVNEIILDAFNDCFNLRFKINRNAEFFNTQRTEVRTIKLQQRGWTLTKTPTEIVCAICGKKWNENCIHLHSRTESTTNFPPAQTLEFH